MNSISRDEVDFWSDMGFGVPAANATGVKLATAIDVQSEHEKKEGTIQPELKHNDDGLPVGGERYKARIYSSSLGVIFFSPAELSSSLFATVKKEAIKALANSPVVGHVFDGSAAATAGVRRGHVLLSVNGQKVHVPHAAKATIRNACRPMQLEFYIPTPDEYEISSQEGMHMVKYDTIDKLAPLSQCRWKPKYVVVGGIIARPWMMMMYRNKVNIKLCVSTLADAFVYLFRDN